MVLDRKNNKDNLQKGVAMAVLRSLKDDDTLDGMRGVMQSVAEMLRLPVGSYVDRERQRLVLVIEAENIFAEIAITLKFIHSLINKALDAIQTDDTKRFKQEVLEMLRREVPILALLAPEEAEEEEEDEEEE